MKKQSQQIYIYVKAIFFFLFPSFLSITLFYISNTSISNARLKLAKNQANAKQHPVAELLLFENYSHSSPTLSSKNNRIYSENISKRTGAPVFIRLIIIKMKTKNRWHRYDINLDLGLDMGTNIVNTSVSLWWCLHVLSNT